MRQLFFQIQFALFSGIKKVGEGDKIESTHALLFCRYPKQRTTLLRQKVMEIMSVYLGVKIVTSV